MNFSKYSFLLMTALLVISARQSDAGVISTIGNAIQSFGSTAADAIGSGISAFIDAFKNALAEAKQHQAADKTKQALNEQASDLSDDPAAQILLTELKNAVDDIAQATDEAYDSLNKANTEDETSELIAIQTLKEAFQLAWKLKESAAIKANLGLGAATQLCKAGAGEGLNEAIQIIANAADQESLGLNAARDLAVEGIKAGKDAPTQALLAAFKGVQSIEELAFNMILKAGEKGFTAIRNQSAPVVENAELDESIEKAAASSPKCQNAIESIKKLSEKALSGTLEPTQRQSIEVVRNGLIAFCKNIAFAGKFGYAAMTDSKDIIDKKIALANVEDGVQKTKDRCLIAVGYGQQALGAAANISGSTLRPAFIEAMRRIEKARTDLLTGLGNAELLAIQGIKFDSQEKGLTAGHEGVATAGFSAYARAEESAKIAFEAGSKK